MKFIIWLNETEDGVEDEFIGSLEDMRDMGFDVEWEEVSDGE